MKNSSKLLEDAINEIAKLPGIGKKSAMRMALFLLNQPTEMVDNFAKTILKLRNEILFCKICNNISDFEICEICNNEKRDFSTICVVESIREVLAIENTHQYSGVYHVLGGILSPIDGVGIKDLNIENLEKRIQENSIQELILALRPTFEGDTTNYYLNRKFKPYNLKITTLARGIAVGDELEYTDEVTLGRSILQRIPFEN